jgi:hypothetical protein
VADALADAGDAPPLTKSNKMEELLLHRADPARAKCPPIMMQREPRSGLPLRLEAQNRLIPSIRRCHNAWWENNVATFQPGQSVHVNLEGIQVGNVLFHAAVNAAVGHIVRQTSDTPAKYLIKLLFSFRGVSEVEVTEDRISPA